MSLVGQKAAVVSFGKIFVFAHLLSPRGFGQYNLALLIFQFANYFGTVGLAEGLARQIPILRANSEGSRKGSLLPNDL